MEDKELSILHTCFQQLNDLDEGARYRVLHWLNDRFEYEQQVRAEQKSERADAPRENDYAHKESMQSLNGKTSSNLKPAFENIEELIALLKPRTAAEKVLIVGYYLQEIEKEEGLSGRLINNELKLIEEGVKNITATINTLIEREPALMIQVNKRGTRPQSQKTYKVSKSGLQQITEKLASKV